MKNRSRRILLALFILFSVAALMNSCAPPSGDEGKTLIIFWDFPRLPAVRAWLEDAVARYEKEHPKVDIQYTCLSWSKGGERMAIAAFAGRPPDVAGAVLDPKYVQAGLLAPVDKYLEEPIPGDPEKRSFKDDVHPSILDAVKWRGKSYAFPWYKEGMVMLCNEEIFEERGVEPPENGRWDWDEFIEKMERLTFDEDGDGRTDVYGVGFNTGYEKWEAYPFLLGEGMKILSEDKKRILTDSQGTREGLWRLLQLEYEYEVSLPGAGGITDSTTWTAFSGEDRRLAVTCQGLWAIKAVKAQNERREELIEKRGGEENVRAPLHVAVVHYPRMPGREQVMASYGVGSYMIFDRPEEPERTEAAARFARWLTLEVGQKINKIQGVMPSRISYSDIFDDDPLYNNVADAIPSAISPPVHPAWRNIDQVINEQIQLVLLRQVPSDDGGVINESRTGPLNESDRKAVDVAVTRMAEKAQLILDDYWRARGDE